MTCCGPSVWIPSSTHCRDRESDKADGTEQLHLFDGGLD